MSNEDELVFAFCWLDEEQWKLLAEVYLNTCCGNLAKALLIEELGTTDGCF